MSRHRRCARRADAAATPSGGRKSGEAGSFLLSSTAEQSGLNPLTPTVKLTLASTLTAAAAALWAALDPDFPPAATVAAPWALAGCSLALGLAWTGRSRPGMRVLLATIAITGAFALRAGGEAAVAGSLMLAFVAALGAASERTRPAALAWLGVTAACLLSGRWVEGHLAATLLLAGGLTALWRHSLSITDDLRYSNERGEVARNKLRRAHRELEQSIDQAESALVKLSTVVDNLADGLLAMRTDGHIELTNRSLLPLLGLTVAPVDATADELLPDPLLEVAHDCMAAAETREANIHLGERVLSGIASPIQLQEGLWGCVVMVRDVTLQAEVDRMKSDFIAVVSHEMRTPLTSVLGFTRIIEKQLERRVLPHVTDDSPRTQRAVQTIRGNLSVVHEEGQRLTDLINNVLDISKMESGQMIWNLEPHPPSELVLQACRATSSLLEGRDEVTVVQSVPDTLPHVHADRDRIVQVLINLLSNALKFTDAGTVEVGAEVADEDVLFWVSDEGAGIDPADQAAVFDKFRQVGDTMTDRPQGTGLGLPICREIVTHHGGRIEVESTPGEGSRFTFTVPRSRRTTSEHAALPPHPR